jgi:hypothetical protein
MTIERVICKLYIAFVLYIHNIKCSVPALGAPSPAHGCKEAAAGQFLTPWNIASLYLLGLTAFRILWSIHCIVSVVVEAKFVTIYVMPLILR